jgi:hypothetical protein
MRYYVILDTRSFIEVFFELLLSYYCKLFISLNSEENDFFDTFKACNQFYSFDRRLFATSIILASMLALFTRTPDSSSNLLII